MSKLNKGLLFLLPILAVSFGLPSCEKFLNPEQEQAITEDKLYDDWYEYRSVEMGLYGLQQKLAEQLLVLGELRGDLLTITPNADPDLVEVYNFDVSKTNKYASPTNFFKLIAASNNFIRVLKKKHPEVLNPQSQVNNFDRLYGEALCMRAWAYFNAVRIYGKVPFIHESLTTIEEIENYVNSPGTFFVDSVHIEYNKDGYHNDTTYTSKADTLEKNYFNTDQVIDYFTNQLEHEVKAVGVNHYTNNNDESWEITIWNPWAMDAMLGTMYLYKGDLYRSLSHFEKIIYNSSSTRRYQIDNFFAYGAWPNIFTSIDNREHIFSIWFNKANLQQNEFQDFFEPLAMHKYTMKPTAWAIQNWESVWRNQVISKNDAEPWKAKMLDPGIPSDFYRGYGSSYLYIKNGVPLSENDYVNMLFLKRAGDDRSARVIMEGMDTMVLKYSIGKDRYDQDAPYIVYRAASIHLYISEIYVYRVYQQSGGLYTTNINYGLGYVNDGSPYAPNNPGRPQLGVRGRVGLASSADDAINIGNIVYIHNPTTNKIIGYKDLNGKFAEKQQLLEEMILDERARELAFEGERFYDLMRVAKRRNDPSFLAKKIAAKFPEGKREQIQGLLMNENNWYINYFDK
jgi:starch-binding outer membrane protein, SusD/RagB family